ncbi:MAG: hypothetical protein IPN07_06380 [Dehalococcoidia bacterium]|nr:hypothetical protein [Dehalococcoidia bacterium]
MRPTVEFGARDAVGPQDRPDVGPVFHSVDEQLGENRGGTSATVPKLHHRAGLRQRVDQSVEVRAGLTREDCQVIETRRLRTNRVDLWQRK